MYSKIKNKKAAVDMPFPFIFSVILIAVVIFVGFYAIRMFLNNAEKTKILQTVEDIKSKVQELSAADAASEIMTFKLNSGIRYLCFTNASTCNANNLPSDIRNNFCSSISIYRGTKKNMFFYPLESTSKYSVPPAQEIYCPGPSGTVKNCLNVTTICFARNLENEFEFRVEKPNENSLVQIKRV